VAVVIPDPDRRGQILHAEDSVDEAIGLGRVVRRAQLEHELVVRAEVGESGSVRTKNGGKGKTRATHRSKEALLQ
jgi:hypothetical protein